MIVSKDLIQKLHDNEIIDKRYPLWWQIGFEGRRIYTEEEFDHGLETVAYNIKWKGRKELQNPTPASYRVWAENAVPILIRNIRINKELELPVFITVKPMSHERGWWGLKISEEFGTPLSVYNSPHIRGLAVEQDKDFFFWYPLLFKRRSKYSTEVFKFNNMGINCIVSPIEPDKFCKNIIKYHAWSHGRRAQKRAEQFNCEEKGYEVTPYFDLDITKKQMIIYPASLFNNKLALPIILGTIPGKKKLGILGTGYITAERAYYWKLDVQKQRQVKNQLEGKLSVGIAINKSG